MSENKPKLLKPALRHYLFWVIDMGCAVAGFVLGFGLEVKSWPALLFFMFLTRWIGDGECADGIPREFWTPEYIKAVDGTDAAIAKAGGAA